MKNLETFFELSNYDTKNITNKGTAIIPKTALDKIEGEGVTLEFLQTLKVPVFKYRTQITIHGLFPELKHNYLGGYKMLFQNKNLSIGVKWNAVDYAKKSKIYNEVQQFSRDWKKCQNSTEFFIYKTSKMFFDKETYKTLLEEAKESISHIDKSLFFGNCGVYLSQSFGGYFLVTYINIGGILEANVGKCTENICKATRGEINAKSEADKIAAAKVAAENEAQRLIDKAEREAKIEALKVLQEPIKAQGREMLTKAGYVLNEGEKPLVDGMVAVWIVADTETGQFTFKARKFTKEPRQKKFRWVEIDSPTLEFDFSKVADYRKQETIRTTVKGGYIKGEPKQPAKIEAKKETVVQVKATVSGGGGVKIINYSSKSIAVVGDTYPIKDTLRNLGGKFNKFLTVGAGWVFPITQKETLQNRLQIAN